MSVVKSKPSLLKLRRGKRAGDTEVQVVEVKMEDGDLTVMAEPKSGSKASKCAKSLSNAAKLPNYIARNPTHHRLVQFDPLSHRQAQLPRRPLR